MRDEELRAAGPPNTFDNTLLTGWQKCHRQTYWFLRRLTTQRTPSYFIYGRAWGVTLNKWHSTEGENKEIRVTKALLAGRKVWDSEPIEIYENRPNDTWQGLEAMFEWYVEAYGEEEPWRQIGDEVGFRFPIPNTTLFYGGSLDAYIEWEPYGVMSREDKAPGSYLTQGYRDQWSHVSQISGYLWALHQLVEKPFGVMMNISSKRPRKDNLLRFGRDLQTRSEWRIAEFMKDTVAMCDEFRREWDKGGWLWAKTGERDPYACSGGPGLSPCIYKSLCLQEMLPWEMEEKYNFTEQFRWSKRKWTPWNRSGE